MKLATFFLSLALTLTPSVFAEELSGKATPAVERKAKKIEKSKKKPGAKKQDKKKDKNKKDRPKLDESGKKMKVSPPPMSHAPKAELPKQEGDALPAPQDADAE